MATAKPKTDEAPPWLLAMRAITGLTETPGSASNPNILKMRDYIAQKFPEQANYAALYTSDDIAWCGLTEAYCMAVANISGPFGATDTERWMWALAWSEDPNYQRLDSPRLGCVLVKEREGGGHVCMYEATEGNTYLCRGGNQSDAVTLANYPISDFVGAFWPRAGGPVPPAERRTISRGMQGSDVAECQRILGLPADGDFGAITESGVKQYQGACGLSKDGVVGPMTWDALDELDGKMKAGSDGISDELAKAIDDLCAGNPINNYSWPDRGKLPPGYYSGMCKSYALALTRLDAGDPAVEIMAQADTGNTDKDALAWYATELEDAELDTSEDGVDTLRALFVMMIGLGPRESSGNHWEGRDMSASNTSSDTCEAGLFQTSWNIRSCSSTIPPLLTEYWDDPNGFRPSFDKGVSPTSSNLDAYGSGDGAKYQFLAKFSPAFAVLVTGVGMRLLRGHWGPIGRREVDIVGAVDDLLIEVEQLVSTTPEPGPEPEPEPGEATVTITVTTQGDVAVHVVENEGPSADPAKVTVGVKSKGDVIVDVQENVPGRLGRKRR